MQDLNKEQRADVCALVRCMQRLTNTRVHGILFEDHYGEWGLLCSDEEDVLQLMQTLRSVSVVIGET